MVVFNCNACGESLKKNQVEKHYTSVCRRCEVLSCVDCGKDFWGDDYKEHTKCISEEEKYSGKDYKPKPGANKGEAKQEAWLQKVQEAIDNSQLDGKLKDLLERMKDYPNIPRKKAKFENFLSNSLRVYDRSLSAKVWDMLMTNVKQETISPEIKDKVRDEKSVCSSSTEPANPNVENGKAEVSSSTDVVDNKQELYKLSKQQRKEERKRLRKCQKDVDVSQVPVESNDLNKKRKRKHREVVDEESTCNEVDSNTNSKKNKRKKHKDDETRHDVSTSHDDTDGVDSDKTSGTNSRKNKVKKHLEETRPGVSTDQDDTDGVASEKTEDESLSVIKKPKTKIHFDWESIILAVVQSKSDKEISLKRLKKKVIAEYLACGGVEASEEKLWAKFDKKVKRNPALKVIKDRVRLVE